MRSRTGGESCSTALIQHLAELKADTIRIFERTTNSEQAVVAEAAIEDAARL